VVEAVRSSSHGRRSAESHESYRRGVAPRASQPSFTPLDADRPSLTDQVAAAIREAAREGQLVPGELYSAYQVSEMLGVSRAPVREAVMRLAEAGVIRIERNRGFRLVVPDAREIAEIFHIRLLLEVPAARLAATRRRDALVGELRAELKAMSAAADQHDETLFMAHDQGLHAKILRAAGNERLASTVASLRELTRVLGASTVDNSRGLQEIHCEHVPVVDAIADRDADKAGQAMREHIRHTGRLLVAQSLAAGERGHSELDALWTDVVGEDES